MKKTKYYNLRMVSYSEIELLIQIRDRYTKEVEPIKDGFYFISMLERLYLNEIIDLKKLLTFPLQDFRHDISGIRANIDFTNCCLKNHFLPRCSTDLKLAI